MWLNVSAGVGTSPFAPIRFACRPEATLLSALNSGTGVYTARMEGEGRAAWRFAPKPTVGYPGLAPPRAGGHFGL